MESYPSTFHTSRIEGHPCMVYIILYHMYHMMIQPANYKRALIDWAYIILDTLIVAGIYHNLGWPSIVKCCGLGWQDGLVPVTCQRCPQTFFCSAYEAIQNEPSLTVLAPTYYLALFSFLAYYSLLQRPSVQTSANVNIMLKVNSIKHMVGNLNQMHLLAFVKLVEVIPIAWQYLSIILVTWGLKN